MTFDDKNEKWMSNKEYKSEIYLYEYTTSATLPTIIF